MSLPDLAALQQAGMEKAAVAWETIEAANPPFDPINLLKGISSIKCAEMLTRLRSTDADAFSEVVDIISQFIQGTLNDVGGAESGNMTEGMLIVETLEALLPFSEEEFGSPKLFAIRMHTYDGLLLLAASKMGKEIIVRERIEQMQMDISMFLLRDIVRRARTEQGVE